MRDDPLTAATIDRSGARRGTRFRQTRTREALLSAARRLMAQGSRAAFTIDDLIQSANVAKGSFYNHFPDKEAIADEVHRIIRETEEAEVRAINCGIVDPVARIARGMAVYGKMALTAPEDARILTLSQVGGGVFGSPVNDGLAIDLRAALRDGRIVVPSVEAAAMLVIGQVAIMIARLGAGITVGDAQLLAQPCIAITLVGLGLPHRDAQLIATQAVDAVLRAD